MSKSQEEPHPLTLVPPSVPFTACEAWSVATSLTSMTAHPLSSQQPSRQRRRRPVGERFLSSPATRGALTIALSRCAHNAIVTANDNDNDNTSDSEGSAVSTTIPPASPLYPTPSFYSTTLSWPSNPSSQRQQQQQNEEEDGFITNFLLYRCSGRTVQDHAQDGNGEQGRGWGWGWGIPRGELRPGNDVSGSGMVYMRVSGGKPVVEVKGQGGGHPGRKEGDRRGAGGGRAQVSFVLVHHSSRDLS